MRELGFVLPALIVLCAAEAVACEAERPCNSAQDVDLTSFYPELGRDGGTPEAEAAAASAKRHSWGLPDDAPTFLAQPCEKSCQSFIYHGNYESETLTGCRAAAENDAGNYVLHCEARLNGSCGGSQLKLP